jgi:hypothetical protein
VLKRVKRVRSTYPQRAILDRKTGIASIPFHSHASQLVIPFSYSLRLDDLYTHLKRTGYALQVPDHALITNDVSILDPDPSSRTLRLVL